MGYCSNHAATKLIIILLLILVVVGVFRGTDIIVSTISSILGAVIPCVITIGGLYILIKALFK